MVVVAVGLKGRVVTRRHVWRWIGGCRRWSLGVDAHERRGQRKRRMRGS